MGKLHAAEMIAAGSGVYKFITIIIIYMMHSIWQFHHKNKKNKTYTTLIPNCAFQ